MKSKKILTISEFFPPNIKGGAEISTKILVDQISKDHSCIVATSKFDAHYNNKNYAVYSTLKRCDYNGGLFNKIFYAIDLSLAPIYNYFKIKRLVLLENPDLIHIIPTHFTYFKVISLLSKLNKPIIIDIRDYSFNSPFGIDNDSKGLPITFVNRAMSKKGLSKFLFLIAGFYELIFFKIYCRKLKKLIKSSNLIRIVSLSNFVRQRLIEAGYSKSKIIVIPNISEPIKFKQLKRKNKIIFAGRIEKEKGIWDVIKAFEILKDKSLVFEIAGEGTELGVIKDHILRNKLKNIKLLGKLPPEKILELYNESKIIVAPSIWPEPFGRFIQESITSQTPCIATNVGGIPEGIKHKRTGMLVEPNNPKQLAKAIKELLTNKKLYNKIVKNLGKESYKYSPERIGRQRLRLYKSILKEHRSTSPSKK